MVEFATRQHGIVNSEELARGGVPRSTTVVWVRAGRLFRLHRGVFSVIPPSMLKVEGHWLAAVKRCGRSAVLSHGPAGQLAGIVPRRERFALHVSLAERARRNPPGIVVHRPRSLDRIDTTTRLGIPTTTPTRTIWDLATILPAQQTRRAFEQAERHDLLSRPRLANFSAPHPPARVPG